MTHFNVFDELKQCIASGALKVIANIDESVIPYKAEFLADPFIYHHQNAFHILCEVQVKRGDKRITHIKSTDNMKTWQWVADVVTGMDLSFPAVYMPDTANPDEMIIIPQVSKIKELIAYTYNPQKPVSNQKLWTIKMVSTTNDQIIVKHPVTAETYLIFSSKNPGGKFKWTGLYASKIENPFTPNIQPTLSQSRVIVRKTLWDIALKFLKHPRLAFRPAGNVLQITDKFFVIPIQAKKKGIYGELMAFLTISWDEFTVTKKEYFNPLSFGGNDIERMHHISWTKNLKGETIFCHDFIRPGNKEKWELIVFQAKNSK